MGETFEPGSWGVDMEVNLFHAMRGHKPVGVNRHFHMIVIHEKLSSPSTKKLSANDVWNHLSTMYDLQALNESEILPFPNKPVDFKLPGEYRSFDDSDFPRMQNVGTAPAAEDSKAKPEGQAKGGKASRSEGKSSHQSKDSSSKGSSADHKASSKGGDSKSSTPEGRSSHSSKADSKTAGSSSSSKASSKGGHSSSDKASPKRTKRTRASPGDAPPSKRRR